MHEQALGIPRVELPAALTATIAAALAAATLARFGLTAEGLIAAATLVVLTALSAIDLRERRLPNTIVLPAAAVALAAQCLAMPDRTWEWVLSAFLAAAVLLVFALINPGGIGMGDVKLCLLLGAVLGSLVVEAFVLAFLAIVPVAAVLFARQGKAARKATIPLGPFLAFGAAAILLLSGPREPLTVDIVVPIQGQPTAGAGR